MIISGLVECLWNSDQHRSTFITIINVDKWSSMLDSNQRSSAPKADGINQTTLMEDYLVILREPLVIRTKYN